MRFFLLALCLLLSACASTERQEPLTSVEILEIKPRYIPEQSFMRVGEYMTGKEVTGDRVIIRSQPGQRSGYYFTLVLDEKVRRLPSGTVIVGEFYTPQSADAITIEFKLPPRLPKTNEVFVGLTGQDWPNADDVPGAWRFTIKDANDKVLATEKSFLWSI